MINPDQTSFYSQHHTNAEHSTVMLLVQNLGELIENLGELIEMRLETLEQEQSLACSTASSLLPHIMSNETCFIRGYSSTTGSPSPFGNFPKSWWKEEKTKTVSSAVKVNWCQLAMAITQVNSGQLQYWLTFIAVVNWHRTSSWLSLTQRLTRIGY